MTFRLIYSTLAAKQRDEIFKDVSKKNLQKQLKKILKYLKTNPRHPSLNTHTHVTNKRDGIIRHRSYVQNNTPRAYRIIWKYGKLRGTIELLEIIPHED